MIFEAGEVLKTKGLDMSCTEVQIRVKFVKYLPVGKVIISPYTGNIMQQDCHIKSNGIIIIADSSELTR